MKKIRNILLAVVVLPCLVPAGMGVADHDAQAEGKVYVPWVALLLEEGDSRIALKGEVDGQDTVRMVLRLTERHHRARKRAAL